MVEKQLKNVHSGAKMEPLVTVLPRRSKYFTLGNVATCLRHGGIFNDEIITNLLMSLQLKLPLHYIHLTAIFPGQPG